MAFLDEVTSHRKLTSTGCGMRKWLDNQTDITDDDIEAGVTEVSASAAHRALKERGFNLGLGVVVKHVQGNCSCRAS